MFLERSLNMMRKLNQSNQSNKWSSGRKAMILKILSTTYLELSKNKNLVMIL